MFSFLINNIHHEKNNFVSCTIVGVTAEANGIPGFGFIDYFLRQLK